jgi:hypothetical protein
VLDPTYPLSVEKIGDFRFRKRKVPDQIRIQADAVRLMGGVSDDPDLTDFAMAWSTLKTLAVAMPEGFDMDEMDPLDSADTDRVWAVWRALRVEEAKFRKGA